MSEGERNDVVARVRQAVTACEGVAHRPDAGFARPLRAAPRSGWAEFIPACTDDALAGAAIFRRAWRAAAGGGVVPV
ncbi:MAG: hypothetical protein ACK53A_16230 [Gemmatimonadota bacterium]|jgi:hypothetical protein|nr:hypothetical protein [Gemmatimonadota bacterium]